MVTSQDGLEQGVVVLWGRALEVRGPVGRRVLPRTSVRAVQDVRGAHETGFVVDTGTDRLTFRGSGLAALGRRVAQWCADAPDDRVFGRDEAAWTGGWVFEDSADGRRAGLLCATSEDLLFLPHGKAGRPERWAWTDVAFSEAGHLVRASGATVQGDGVPRVRALQLAGGLGGPSGGIGLVARVTVGWMRARHLLAIGRDGLALTPEGRWGRLWSRSRTVPWSSVHVLRSVGPNTLAVGTPDGELRLVSPWASSLVAELRRQRLAVARRDDEVARSVGRRQAGWVVQARQGRSRSWEWARLRRDGPAMVLTRNREVVRLPLVDLGWRPLSDRPLTLAVTAGTHQWRLRPVGGHRFLPDWTRQVGPPLPEWTEDAVHVSGRKERRRDTRIALAVDAWLHPRGGVPDTSPDRTSHTVEVSMSSVVVRWTGPLEVGQEVGLALGMGGPPIATRARVLRRVRDDLWAVGFVSPPGALVHRIGSRVRAQERADRATGRTEWVALTAEG